MRFVEIILLEIALKLAQEKLEVRPTK